MMAKLLMAMNDKSSRSRRPCPALAGLDPSTLVIVPRSAEMSQMPTAALQRLRYCTAKP
jgi:hypothetical protein